VLLCALCAHLEGLLGAAARTYNASLGPFGGGTAKMQRDGGRRRHTTNVDKLFGLLRRTADEASA
jgi:hypothetical protein